MRISRATKLSATAGTVLLLAAALSQAQVSFYGPIVAPTGSSMRAIESSDAQANGGDEAAGGGAVDLAEGIFANKPFTLTASVREGWDSNTLTTSDNDIGSFYTNFAAGASYAFGTPRFQLNANIGGGVTYYYDRPGEKTDLNASLGLTATYLATERLTLSFATSTAWMSQPDITYVGGTNRQDGDYFYTNTSLSASYQWSEKVSTITSYNATVFYYADKNLNDNQGHFDNTLSQSVNYLLLPKTTISANYAATQSTYYDADLNSFQNYFSFGVDQVFNPRLRFSARLGAQVNFNNNPVDGQSVYVGPYGETTLSYQFGQASTLAWVSRYGTEASGLDDVTQRVTFRTGLTLTHAFTNRLSGALNVSYLNNNYQQDDVIQSYNESIFDAGVSLNYQFNRFTSVSIGYQYTQDIAPGYSDAEYVRQVAFTGLNFTF